MAKRSNCFVHLDQGAIRTRLRILRIGSRIILTQDNLMNERFNAVTANNCPYRSFRFQVAILPFLVCKINDSYAKYVGIDNASALVGDESDSED